MKTVTHDGIDYRVVKEIEYHSCKGCEARERGGSCLISGSCFADRTMGTINEQGYILKRIPAKAKKETPVKVLDETELFVAMQAKWIKLHGIKNGDKVKVIAAFDGKGGCESSCTRMTGCIGKVYEIVDDFTQSMNIGINLRGGPVLPYFCLEPIKDEPKVYHIGQRFGQHDTADYILANVDTLKVSFINLISGTRWTNPILVNCVDAITEEELKACNGVTGNFKLIE